AGVKRQVVGVSDIDAARRLAQVLQQLGTERALVVHGSDGLDELSLGAPSTIFDVTPHAVTVTTVSAADVGLTPAPLTALSGGDRATNARMLREVLQGTASTPVRDVVLLNASAALVAADIAEDLRDGVDQARSAIRDGRAFDRLTCWVAASRGSREAAS
ncbi:MAG: anthranilate phosphoribosyltransferase, partial [Thermoleophilia bacterium]|nr:anthranilate phosphoribosyltransferase [Thermoleophilia bacterium]